MLSIFFDLDGVLCHFVRGALKAHGREDVPHREIPWGLEAHLGIEPKVFWDKLDHMFAAELEPYADGMALLKEAERLVGAENIGILSSPWDTPGCFEGKKAWIAKHLPDYSRRFFTGSAKHLFAGPTKILVDDHNPNIDKFREAGGAGLLIPRPWNTAKSECCSEGMFSVQLYSGALCSMVQILRGR